MIRRLRWRLARYIAPAPIMRDPFPGHQAIVISRKGGTVASWSLTELEVTSTNEPPVFRPREGDIDLTIFGRGRRVTTFTGKAIQ